MNTSIPRSIQLRHLLPQYSPQGCLFRSERIPYSRPILLHCLNKLQHKLCLSAFQTEIRQKGFQNFLYLCIGNLPNIPFLVLRITRLMFPSPATKCLMKKIWNNRTDLGQTHLSYVVDTLSAILTAGRGLIPANSNKAICINRPSQIRIRKFWAHMLLPNLPFYSQTDLVKMVTQWNQHYWNNMPPEVQHPAQEALTCPSSI